MAPWRGPRHRSWASDTNLSLVFAGAIVTVYLLWELVGQAPQGMVTLVGLAGGALLGATSGDRSKRNREVDEKADDAKTTAERAEVKADRLVQVAEAEPPEATHATGLPEPTADEGKAP